MSKSGQPWTQGEEQQMLDMIRQKQPFPSIARVHGRSVKAIQLRFGGYCNRKIQSKSTTLSQLSDEFNVDANVVADCIDQLSQSNSDRRHNMDNQSVSLSSSGSFSDIAVIKEEISDIQTRLSKLSKTLKKFIETTTENHKEVKTMLSRQESKNEIRKHGTKEKS